jgi:hypothetical protein
VYHFRFFDKDTHNIRHIKINLTLVQITNRIINSKEAEIESLKQQLNFTKSFTVEDVVVRFNALKEYYTKQVKEWYAMSIENLTREKEEAINRKEKELNAQLELEIEKRTLEFKHQIENYNNFLPILDTEIDPCGNYSVVGYNPFDSEKNEGYTGLLSITKKNDVFYAYWVIQRQKFKGVGMLVGRFIGFNFMEIDGAYDQNGIVIYNFISENMIRGYWTGFDASQIGQEEGRRKL